MGYTHYWRRPKILDAKKFKDFSADCKKLADAAGVELCGDTGEGQDLPDFDDTFVYLNGVGKYGHEPFVIQQEFPSEQYGSPARIDDYGLYFAFCKTRREPYDLVVCGCLIRFKHHFGDAVVVDSDGRHLDWMAGLTLCKNLFGVGELPFTKEQ
jgi:hypothetical protein